jgi:hypothetical protein
MSRLRGPSRKGIYAFLLVVSALAIQYLPSQWLPNWLVPVVFLEMACVTGGFLLELRRDRRDRRDAEARRAATLREREAHPLRYSHQPRRGPAEPDLPVT